MICFHLSGLDCIASAWYLWAGNHSDKFDIKITLTLLLLASCTVPLEWALHWIVSIFNHKFLLLKISISSLIAWSWRHLKLIWFHDAKLFGILHNFAVSFTNAIFTDWQASVQTYPKIDTNILVKNWNLFITKLQFFKT